MTVAGAERERGPAPRSPSDPLLKRILTDFRSSVEPAHQIRGDVIVGNVRSRAEIAQLQDGLRLVHLWQTQTH